MVFPGGIGIHRNAERRVAGQPEKVFHIFIDNLSGAVVAVQREFASFSFHKLKSGVAHGFLNLDNFFSIFHIIDHVNRDSLLPELRYF